MRFSAYVDRDEALAVLRGAQRPEDEVALKRVATQIGGTLTPYWELCSSREAEGRLTGRSVDEDHSLRSGTAECGQPQGLAGVRQIASGRNPDQESSMPYIEGFVAAVPTANKDEYVEHARQASTYFKGLGATRVIECWGDDVPKGEVTDFYKAAQVKEDETPIFSWIEYPDKATRDAANEKMSQDPEMGNMEMPFDGSRMFWGGFEQVVNE